jgi:thiamine biosynthesis lipoprotein
MTVARATRRRVLALAAAAGLGGLAPALAGRLDRPRRLAWSGPALGTSARIVLYHRDAGRARATLLRLAAEIGRLEGIFSLFRPDSTLSRLNREGRFEAPPAELRQVLALALRIAEASHGAFDPTVQPLWRLYARHFATGAAAPPDSRAIEAAVRRVDWRRLDAGSRAVALGPGMALTLDGIAQGYVTDRIAALLGDAGYDDVLVDAGELVGLGGRGDGSPWRVRLEPSGAVVALSGAGLATSAARGTTFDAAGRFGHVLDPRTGRAAPIAAAVSTVAPSAALADALATALCLLDAADRRALLAAFPGASAWTTGMDA